MSDLNQPSVTNLVEALIHLGPIHELVDNIKPIDASKKSVEDAKAWTKNAIEIKDRLTVARNKFIETTKQLKEESALIKDKISLHEKEYDNLIYRRDLAVVKEGNLIDLMGTIQLEILNIKDQIDSLNLTTQEDGLQIDSLQNEIQTLNNKSEELRKEYEDIQNAHMIVQNNISDLEFSEVDIKSVIKQLVDEHGNIINNINKLQSLKTEMTLVSTNLEEAVMAMTTQYLDVDGVRNETRSANKEFKSLKIQQDDIITLSTTVDALERTIDKLQFTMKIHEGTYISLQQEFSEKNNKFKTLETNLSKCKENADIAMRDYNNAIASKNTIKSVIENLKITHNSKLEMYNNFKSDVDIAAKNVNDATIELNKATENLNTDLITFNNRCIDINQMISKYSSEAADMQNQLIGYQLPSDDLKKKNMYYYLVSS